jgi:hypothetical protein
VPRFTVCHAVFGGGQSRSGRCALRNAVYHAYIGSTFETETAFPELGVDVDRLEVRFKRVGW